MKKNFLVCSFVALFLTACGNKIDSQLDSLEDSVEEVVELAEKVKDGNLSAIKEIDEIVEETQSLGMDLGELRDEMTPEQKDRLDELCEKMSDAMDIVREQ